MNDRIKSVLAGIQSVQEMLANLRKPMETIPFQDDQFFRTNSYQ